MINCKWHEIWSYWFRSVVYTGNSLSELNESKLKKKKKTINKNKQKVKKTICQMLKQVDYWFC